MTSNRFAGRSFVLATIGIGAAVGVMSGLFGLGGGALLIVGLVTIGFHQHAAHATSLAAIALIASAAVVPFAVNGEVALAAAAVLAPSAMLGAFAGAGIMRRIPEDRLRITFVIFILLVAVRLLWGVETSPGPGTIDGWLPWVGLGLLGVATGVLSSIMGVGGGLVFVPALVLLFDFGQHAAEGTSLAVVIPTALVGALRHSGSGFTSWRTGAILGISGLLGGVAGAYLALALEGLTLQRLFAVFLIIMALRLLWTRKQPGQPSSDPPTDPAR